jgi:hypothetical protein
MERHIAGNELSLVFIPKFREYGILYTDGGSSFQVMEYCPWCGARLPESLRGEWFDAIETMGPEPDDENIPKEYLSEEWHGDAEVYA